jgi:hypothetical protein
MQGKKILRVGFVDDLSPDAIKVEPLDSWINRAIENGNIWEFTLKYVLVEAEIPLVEGETPIDSLFLPPDLQYLSDFLGRYYLENAGEYILRCSEKLSHLGISGYLARELEKKFGWRISFSQEARDLAICLCYQKEEGKIRCKCEVKGAGFIKFMPPSFKEVLVYGRSPGIQYESDPLILAAHKLAGALLKEELEGWEIRICGTREEDLWRE